MELIDSFLSVFQPYYNELKQLITELRTDTDKHDDQIDHLRKLLTRDSNFLTSLLFQKVFDGKIAVSGNNTTNHSDPFDISQGALDSNGNAVYPHAFYLISAFSPSLTAGVAGGPVEVVYQGTPIIINDTSVYLTRTAAANPSRFETKISVYKLPAGAIDLYVRVLKLLGTR